MTKQTSRMLLGLVASATELKDACQRLKSLSSTNVTTYPLIRFTKSSNAQYRPPLDLAYRQLTGGTTDAICSLRRLLDLASSISHCQNLLVEAGSSRRKSRSSISRPRVKNTKARKDGRPSKRTSLSKMKR